MHCIPKILPTCVNSVYQALSPLFGRGLGTKLILEYVLLLLYIPCLSSFKMVAIALPNLTSSFYRSIIICT